jgi:2-C-methyl-D-erythritol 4-phosphate cytidylyltransferase
MTTRSAICYKKAIKISSKGACSVSIIRIIDPTFVNSYQSKQNASQVINMEQIAIIVAGGSGKRMNTEIPKQFLLLGGLPVLMRTINAFHGFNPVMKVIVALGADHVKYWQTLCRNHNYTVPHMISEGGRTRYHSVRNAMEHVPPGCLVAVHDGVRPLVGKALIQTCFDTAAALGSAIPVTELTETIRQISGKTNAAADRSRFRLVQTPQVFRSDLLIEAFRQPYKSIFTDEAILVEASGHPVNLVKGQQENIKITNMADLFIASAILENIHDL